MSLQRERTFILALLLILAAASWAVLIWQARMMKSMGMGLTPGDLGRDDDRDDVSRDSHDEPGFRAGPA